MLTESSFKDGASAPFAESASRPLIDSRSRPELAKWDTLLRTSREANVHDPVVQISLNSYPTTRKIKVSICRQDGVLTIVARMIGQLQIG